MDKKFIPIIAILFSVLGFSLKAIFIKLSFSEVVDGIAVMGYRSLLSLPFFAVLYYFLRCQEGKNKSTFFKIIVCSSLFYFASLFDTLALERISVNIERTILFMTPIFVLALSWIFLKKSYSVGVYVATGISWLGIGLFFLSKSSVDAVDFIGISYVILSVLSYSGYLLLSAHELKHRHALTFNAQVMTLCCIIALPLVLVHSHFDFTALVPQEGKWTYPLCLALISTVIPSFLMMYGMKKVGPVVSTTLNNIGPFITTLAGYLVLFEPVTLLDFAGMCVVLSTIYYINKHA